MTSDRLTLEQCGTGRRLRALAPGLYDIEYTDSTHLQPTEWVRLATVNLQSATIPLQDEGAEPFYSITKRIGDLPGRPAAGGSNTSKSAEKPDPVADHQRRVRVVEDTLGLALGRVGLLAPDVPPELLEELIRLDRHDGVVIVPDTNSLHNGAVHWLLRVLRRPSVWLMPVVASMTTIQTRDAIVKGLVNKRKIGNLGQALRSRGLVNGALGLLERNKGRCQVVEIDPSLLRYQKMASSTGADPDLSDVLEDRLIIEAIHGVLRSMRSRTARRVVTSDVNVARVLTAEGIETLFVPGITLGEAAVDCLRFDALARVFIGAPLRATLWELAHAFGTIRLLHEGIERVRLECYWPNKTPTEWTSEVLLCRFDDGAVTAVVSADDLAPAVADGPAAYGPAAIIAAGAAASAPPAAIPPAPAPSNKGAAPIGLDARGQSDAGGNQRRASGATTASVAPKRLVPITTSLPRASLPQMLRLLGIARRFRGGSVEQLVAEMRTEPISPDKARRPLEILRRMELIEQVGDRYNVRGDADVVDAMLRAGDLDSLSAVLERFVPYRRWLTALKDRGRVRRFDVASLMQELIGPAGTAESDRLPRFHVLLGQAWTDGEWIVDGSNRPVDRDATDTFEEAFRVSAKVGIAKVQDLLFKYCELSRMSPWAAKRQIERFVAGRMLPGYSFQPAAGAKPITRDEIVAGGLDRVEVKPIIVDRLFLGERPVFTIEGPAR